MNAKRSLRVRSEVLTELASDELSSVVGADAVTIMSVCYGVCHTWPIYTCCIRCIPPE